MSDVTGINTWDAMRNLGFTLDGSCPFSEMPALVFDFGPVRLQAAWVMGRFFNDIVFVTGIWQTARTMAQIEIQMPRTIDSVDLCAAWIVDKLDRVADGGLFIPSKPIEWLQRGRLHQEKLPWRIQQAAREAEYAVYQARPHCQVDREWMRVIRVKLRESLETCSPDDLISFSFTAGILTICLPTDKLACQAEGDDWPHVFAVPAANLKKLPKRFKSNYVIVGEWKGSLEIADSRYEGVSILNGVNNEQP